MYKKALSILICLILFTSVLGGCGSSPASAPPPATTPTPAPTPAPTPTPTPTPGTEQVKHDPYSIDIYSFQTGTFVYVVAMAWADLINKYSDWLTAVCVEAPGTLANEQMLQANPAMRKNTVIYGICYDATRGLGQFEGKATSRNKQVANFGLVFNGLVTCDPTIKTLKDCVGKTIALRANGAMNPYAEASFNAVVPGVKYEGMDMTQGVEATLGKRVVGSLAVGYAISPTLDKWVPNPAYQELLSRADYIAFISAPEDVMNNLRKESGGDFESYWMCAGTIPAMSYDDRQTEPWTVFCNNSGFFVDEDMDDEVVEEMTRILLEHYKELADYHPQAAALEPANICMYSGPVEFHPAAIKCYSDFGVKPTDMMDFMAALNK